MRSLELLHSGSYMSDLVPLMFHSDVDVPVSSVNCVQ